MGSTFPVAGQVRPVRSPQTRLVEVWVPWSDWCVVGIGDEGSYSFFPVLVREYNLGEVLSRCMAFLSLELTEPETYC